MPEYPAASDGEWLQPRRRNYMLECCDCGLIHRLNFRLVRGRTGGRKIQFQAFRDKRATKKSRSKQGIKITRKQKRKDSKSG